MNFAVQNEFLECEEIDTSLIETALSKFTGIKAWKSSCGTFDNYLAQAFAAPLLEATDEIALFERIQKDGDTQAESVLVASYLRLVHYIARTNLGYGIAIDDLVQQGNMGLLKAIRRFDLSMNCRLGTFAKPWITSEINEYAIRNMRIVKMATTKPQRKLFFKLRSLKDDLRKVTNSAPTQLTYAEAEGIAKMLRVSMTDVIEMETRLSGGDCGFDTPVQATGSGFLTAEQLSIIDDSPENLMIARQREWLAHEGVTQALASLDPRSRRIIEGRWIEVDDEGVGMTLNELSQEFGVSIERIRQVEKRAMQKMKADLEEFA